MTKFMKAVAALAFFQSISIAHAETIEIAAIDWCPQLCTNEERQGFILDIVKEVYANSEFNLSINFYPWPRAVASVENGRADILLSPTKNEAPDLLFPDSEVAVQMVCFFTKSDSSWSYTGLPSLKGIKASAHRDGYFGEIDDYMKDNKKQFQYTVGDGNYIPNNLKKMDAGRIDAMLFTKNSVMNEIESNGVSDNYRQAGCVTSEKVYVAFSNNSRNAEAVQSMKDFFDKRMIELRSNGTISAIMGKYGLDDWTKTAP